MEVIEFTYQDGRGSLQGLRSLLAKAVTQSKGIPVKEDWLINIIDNAIVDVGNDTRWAASIKDIKSANSVPGLTATLLTASSNAVIYGGTHKVQLLEDLQAASNVLAS